MKNNLKILGIETSCDETSAAVISCQGENIQVLSNVISSQVKIHAKWGGVVPNLAAREHLKNIVPVLKLALRQAEITPKKLDLIAVTSGPGLIPALLIGTNAAKTLSYVWEKPLIGIHHIEGHIYANFVRVNSNDQIPNPPPEADQSRTGKQIPNPKQIPNSKFQIQNSDIKFPILCLVVSGGHTQLVLMKNHLDYEIIGQTLDDAVGEAFDKTARMLEIGYPGGPAIAYNAITHNLQLTTYNIIFPRPMINKNNFDFSFSGLKTAVLYETKKKPELLKDKKYIAALCYEFQQAAIDVLINKTIKAAKKYNPKTIMLAGGVAANKELRKQLGKAIKRNLPATTYKLPAIKYTGDNAAMIAAAAYFRWKNMISLQKENSLQNWKTLDTDANLKLK